MAMEFVKDTFEANLSLIELFNTEGRMFFAINTFQLPFVPAKGMYLAFEDTNKNAYEVVVKKVTWNISNETFDVECNDFTWIGGPDRKFEAVPISKTITYDTEAVIKLLTDTGWDIEDLDEE